MAKKKSKKLRILIILLILVFTIFLYFLNYRHSYTLEYKVNSVNIVEKYHKKSKYYSFTVTYDNKTYDLISFDKYINKRKLISDITITKKEDTCLSFTSKVSLYDVCSGDNGYYYPYKESVLSEKASYKNIKIDALNNKTYLLWNYSEFTFLNKEKNTSIKLFDKDVYTLNLVYQTDKYLLVPNYDESYKFTKMYFINKDSGKVKSFDLRYEVYFDSYFLGSYKDKVYLYDRKSEIEYYFDLKKEDIYKTSYGIYNDGKWESVSNQKLKNGNIVFTSNKVFTYELDGSKLYDSNKYLVTNREVSKIVKTDNLDVYYISGDTLYYFNPLKGEVPLLKYSEWEFNSANMIFIF